jgi:hypothetical protein
MEEEKENIVTCEDCGVEINKDDSYSVNDSIVCQDCSDNYATCDHCDGQYLDDDMVSLIDSRGNDVYYCQDCFNDCGFSCNDCGDNYLFQDSITTSAGNNICQRCYDSNYFTCESCEEVYHNDRYYGDGCCEDCYQDNNGNEYIHNYHYKPGPIFHRAAGEEKLYMGIELEVEGDQDYAEDLIELSDNEDLFWLEQDSSLNSGFEIVTHPSTLEFYMTQFPLEQISTYLTDHGFKSHDTKTCGLHIHVGKKLLTNTDQIKMGLFVGFNSEKLKILGRRDYNSFCHKKELVKGELKGAKYSSSRYEAINFSNDNIVEFRFFKGTLKHSTILASIQFVHSLVKYCKNNGIPTLVNPCWGKYCHFVRPKKEYITLVTYLNSKGIL